MLNFFFAFFFTFTPAPTDTFVTPYSLAIQAASAGVVVAPTPVVAAVTEPAAAPAAPVAIVKPAATPEPTPVAKAVEPAAPSLFANGGIFDPSRLGNVARGQTRLSADAVVTKVQAFYKDTARLKAKFRQTVKNATFGKESVSDGWVYIKKPGKMRWDYYSKRNRSKVVKSFLSDGSTIWAVFHTDLQYYKKSVKDDLLPVAITFLSGKGDLKADFKAAIDSKSGFGKKGDYVVKLTPKKPNAQYTHLWLVIDANTYRVKQSIVQNSNGDTNKFAFHTGDTKKPIADSEFIFNETAKSNKKFRLINPDKAPK